MSRLLFAWLLLAKIVSLLAGVARTDRQAPHHQATDKHGARIPLFCGDGLNGHPDELAVESKPRAYTRTTFAR